MPKSAIRNLSDKEYSERFMDETITIPPNGEILMEHSKAVRFLGQYVAPKKDGGGNQIGGKPLTLIRNPDVTKAKEVYVNENNERFLSKEEALGKTMESPNETEHGCPHCEFTSPSAEAVLLHIKRDHDTSRDNNRRTLTV